MNAARNVACPAAYPSQPGTHHASGSQLHELPNCLVVHEKNYLATFALRNREEVYLLIDFSDSAGMATVFFMNIFDVIIRGGILSPSVVWDWFEVLGLPF